MSARTPVWMSIATLLAGVLAAAGCHKRAPLPRGTTPVAVQFRSTLLLTVSGTMRPATPLTVTVVENGLVSSSQTRLRVVVIGRPDPSPDDIVIDRIRAVPSEVSVTDRGAVTFERPGYYHIMAVANGSSGEDPRPEGARNVYLADGKTAHAWVLVDTIGGRVDRAYDECVAVDPRRRPQFFSVGAFVPWGWGAAPPRDAMMGTKKCR